MVSPEVEKRRSGAADVAGIASTRRARRETWEDLLTTLPFFERITCLAITGKRSGGGGGWRYTDAPVRGTRSMIGLDHISRTRKLFRLKVPGDTNTVHFEHVHCRTGFVILAPKYLYQILLVNYCLSLISFINHLLYF